MKEIVLIMAYTPTYEKQKLLINLIDFLISNNYKVAVASHTSLPQNIIDRIDYFFYERENKIVYDPKLSYWSFYKNENFRIDYKSYDGMSTHILAIFSIFFSSLIFLKQLGYKIIHHIEYDSILENCDFLKENRNYLNTYDTVLYYSDEFNNKGWAIFGPIFSFNLDKIKNIPVFDEVKILKDYEVAFFDKKNLPAETVLFNYLFSNTNNIWVNINSIGNQFNLSSGTKYSTQICNFHIHGGAVQFFSKNESEYPIEILIIIDNKIFKNFIQPPNNWFWSSTDKKIEEIKKIKLFVNNKLLKEFDLSKLEDLEYITKWSKVSINY